MKKKRIESIDIAKGIGILLVIWGHLTVDGQMSRFVIFTFHMPLFFMLSGVFAGKKQSIADGIVKLLRTLLIPYWIAMACDFVWQSAVALCGGKYDFAEQVKTSLKCVAGVHAAYNRAVWFLFALFIIKVVFLLIGQIENKIAKDGIIIAILAVSVAFILTRQFMEIENRYLYLAALGCFAFYSAGYFLHDAVIRIEESVLKHKIHLILAPLAMVAVVLIARIKEMFYLHTYDYTNHPALMLVAAACGTYAVVVASALIANISKAEWLKNALLFFGKNSVVILLVHYPLARKIYPFVLEKIGLQDYIYRPLCELVLFAVTVLLMILAIYLFNKYLYFIIGKNKPARK